jgi:type IV pilus assembly protein PilB
MAEIKMRLGDFLVSRKIITEEQLNRALQHQKQWGGRLGEALTFLRIVSEDKLLAALKYHLEIPIMDLQEVSISPDVIKLISREMAAKYKAVPVRIAVSFGKKTLLVAMSDPLDIKAIEEIQFVSGYRVQPVLSKERSIMNALNQYYDLDTGYIDPKESRRPSSEEGAGDGGGDDVMTIIRGGDELKITSTGEVVYDDGEDIEPVEVGGVGFDEPRETDPPEEMKKSKGDNKLLRALIKVLIEKEYITIEDLKDKLEE